MDNKSIKEYGEEILCYRLRTARQKKRMQYKDFDKRLLRLAREEKQLYLQRRNLGWEPLVPPVQNGWKRFFVLRDDVARSDRAAFYQGVLDKINTTDKSHKKTFLVRRRKYGKKYYVVREQKLKEPSSYAFEKLGFTEKEKSFFDEVWRMNSCRQMVKHYVFREPWRFVLQVRPNMITGIWVRDAILEAELKRMDNWLERNDWGKRQSKLLHGGCQYSNWWSDWNVKPDEKYVFKNWPLARIIDAIQMEQLNDQ